MVQTVLITGCSSGFGELAATTFHSMGWNVVATMREPSKCTALRSGQRMQITELDVTDTASIDAAVAAGLSRYGAIDALVNNAGFGANGMFEQTVDAVVRMLFETNVFGVMNVTRAVLPGMRARGRGVIVNVTSMAGLFGVPGNSAYTASKFAVEGFTEALALEYRGLGIIAKTVAPGAFSTTGFKHNVEYLVGTGDPQLREHSQILRDHLTGAIHSDGQQDAQVVADKIFECVTCETPLHNAAGRDAAAMMRRLDESSTRQDFIDEIALRLAA